MQQIGFPLMAICWALALGFMVYKSIKDKTHSMPVPALFLNAAWQAMVLITTWHNLSAFIVVGIWFALTCTLIVLYFKYSTPQKPETLKDKLFPVFNVALIIGSVLFVNGVYAITENLENMGAGPAALVVNIIMSAQFCYMGLKRENMKGQSLWIALFKVLGTGATFLYADYSQSHFFFMIPAILIFDLLYIGLLGFVNIRQRKEVLVSG